jgi:sarcosine/dimethylglycine N-methyltransferase
VAAKTSVQQLYGELWADEHPLDVELQETLAPRSTEWLFGVFADLRPQPGQLVVDVGARDAGHAIRLVREHGLRAIALDPVRHHVELASGAVAEAGLENDVEVVEAGIEAMPLADDVADWIWCRDVLVHVDLSRGFAECARVLRPGGRMLAYVTCATELLEPREEGALFGALAIVPESTRPAALERHAADAGLTLVSCTPLGGEWRERMIEDDFWNPGKDLLQLSRLQRREQELVERHGRAAVDAYAAACAWGVYQLLGKLRPTVYVWRLDA